jgi:16S rRNA (uracil1498-N3)-methyltransferase
LKIAGRNAKLPPRAPGPIISRVARRIHVPVVLSGEIVLDESQAHHLRDVLRLKIGSRIELFDAAGMVADAVVTRVDPAGVTVRVDAIERAKSGGELVVASAVPRGDRADWMIEKLSELGVSRFIPLQTARSVVHPAGNSKRDRWMRIATESAKQSHRAGVMRIDELTPLDALLRGMGVSPVHQRLEPQSHGRDAHATWYLSTADDATELRDVINSQLDRLTLFIGPEGGWTDEELLRFAQGNLTPVKLTATILRVETAAIASAAIAATVVLRR